MFMFGIYEELRQRWASTSAGNRWVVVLVGLWIVFCTVAMARAPLAILLG